MKPSLLSLILLLHVCGISMNAETTNSEALSPPDKQKLSYALGMNLGMQIKKSGVAVDPAVVVQAVREVLSGKNGDIQLSDIRAILHQAETSAHLQMMSKNIAAGENFLIKNAKEPGIVALPDGLQYRVIKTGAGPKPKSVDILTMKFRGTWIDGREFKHNDSLDMPMWASPKGLHEALEMMTVGSHWQIYVPYDLAYGHQADRITGYGSVLIYDLELLNAEKETAHPNTHHASGRLGHSMDEDVLPERYGTTANAMH